MSAGKQDKQQDDPPSCCTATRFRETSLILDVLSRQHGRLAIMARGAGVQIKLREC